MSTMKKTVSEIVKPPGQESASVSLGILRSAQLPPGEVLSIPQANPKLTRKSRSIMIEMDVPITERWGVFAGVGACLASGLEKRWHSYCNQLRNCKAKFSQETVHELRVATRRLMTQFILLESVTGESSCRKAWKKLKARLKSMGDLRDAHVQRIFIQERLEVFPELALMEDFLEARQQRLTKTLTRKVAKLRTRKLENWALSIGRQLSIECRDARKRGLVGARVLGEVEAAFEAVANRRRAIDPKDSESIHRTRVAFKKFRYMVETLAPALVGLGKKQLSRLGMYQRRMGTLQDLEILQTCLSRFVQIHPEAEKPLAPFCRYLRLRHARVLRSCLEHADDLFWFWNPSWTRRLELTAA